MPEDLANVEVYARECAQTLLLILNFISEKKRSEKPSLPIPQLGERILDNFRQLIENLDDADSEKVADLVAAYQIQHSRFLSVIRDFQKPNRHGVEQIISENYVMDIA